jgi:hypothetical protein
MIKNLFVNIVSTVIYSTIIIPVGLLFKLFGKDYLDRDIRKQKKSYWN